MTKFIAVISGKGGVGKTTVSINLASALSYLGRRVVVLDADLHTPNVGMYLGHPLLKRTSLESIEGDTPISVVAYRHSSGINIIPSKLNVEGISEDHFRKLAASLSDLDDTVEIVIIDMPSGLSSQMDSVLSRCDYSIIVTSPDFPSVTNALKAKKRSADLEVPILGLVNNMCRGTNIEMQEEEIEAMTGSRVLISIPAEDAIRESVYLKNPVVHSHPDSVSSERFKKLALALIA